MWQHIDEVFSGQRAKLKAVSTMLRLGLRVDKQGRIFCESIELAPAKFARAIGVDRRVVICTAKEIAADPKLSEIFSRLIPTANVSGAAKILGHDVIEIDADPNTTGLVSIISTILARNKVGIRQIIADDPDLYPDPKMHIVADGRLPRKAIEELRNLHLQAISFK
ncbi:MAG: amino acid-binding ACT domain protein [Candidatus Micrarchaeota archaeon]|nr:amino acid-binding ACT domain protein [Candidatus Micrarchaeota archaeon]